MMLDNKKALWIPAAVLIVFIAFMIYYAAKISDQMPSKKPDIVRPEKDQDLTWYIEFTVRDQKSTSYTEETGAPKAASGSHYFLGSGAVHPMYRLNFGGDPRKPIIPFGTVLYFDEPVLVHDKYYDQLIVNDTGDVYYGLWPASPYWVDVYYGASNSYNIRSAGKYGVKNISYKWYEKWQ